MVFLTGDQHYGEVCRLPRALDYDAIELQFAGVNQIEAPEWNLLRVAPVIRSKHSYALLDLKLEATKREVPHLLFQIYDAMNDQLELVYRVNLNELQLHLDFGGAFSFAGKQTIELDHDYADLTLRYTVDGRVPSVTSSRYAGSFPISGSTKVKAAFFDENSIARSRVFEQTYTQLEPLAPVKEQQAPPGLRYQYYEGNYSRLTEVKRDHPVKKGIATELDPMKIADEEDHFAIFYEGLIEVPAAGVYTFSTYSDDGSRLYIHEQLVVDNDGSHSARLRKGQVALQAGKPPIRIEYFEDYEGQTFIVKMADQHGKEEVLGIDRFYRSH